MDGVAGRPLRLRACEFCQRRFHSAIGWAEGKQMGYNSRQAGTRPCRGDGGGR